MGFWESFKQGYRAERADNIEDAYEEVFEQNLEADATEPRAPDFEALLRDRDQELWESKQLVADLAAELQKREEELKIARRTAPRAPSDDKYKKLRRAVVTLVHPDKASDPQIAAVLEGLCKAINAEIDQIERA